jgi:hypothetical protein
MICKALALRQTATDPDLAADLDLLDKAIREVGRQAGYLDEVKTSSLTIKSGAERILARVETMRAPVLQILQLAFQVRTSLEKDSSKTGR